MDVVVSVVVVVAVVVDVSVVVDAVVDVVVSVVVPEDPLLESVSSPPSSGLKQADTAPRATTELKRSQDTRLD